MGVQGLWQLLDPLGRPVTLESLESKILAVDVSIWLNQAIRGCRENNGCLSRNATLQTLFSRICKLLHYRIKPVFVFDGGVPILKKQTLAARRQRKEAAAKRAHGASQKLLMNYIRQQAVRQKLGDESPKSATSSPVKKGAAQVQEDMFELPPLPQASTSHADEEDRDSDDEWSMLVQDHLQHNFQDLDSLDLDSEDFRSLPVDVRHEILTECKDLRKKNSWAQMDEMPKESHKFSSYQMARLLKRRSLQQHLENVEKEITSLKSGYSTGFDDYVNGEAVQKIMSEDSVHFVYLKGKRRIELPSKLNNANESKASDDENVDKESFQTSVPTPSTLNEKESMTAEDEAGDSIVISELDTDTNILEHYQKMVQKATSKLDPAKRLAAESTKRSACASQNDRDDVKDALEKTMEDFFSSDAYSSLINNDKQEKVIPVVKAFDGNGKINEKVYVSDDDEDDSSAASIKLVNEIVVEAGKQHNDAQLLDMKSQEEKAKTPVRSASSDSEDDDDFLEIKINPNDAQEDELFPLEIFQRESENKEKEPTRNETQFSTPAVIVRPNDVDADSQHVHVNSELEETDDSITLPSAFELDETASEMVTVPTGSAVNEDELRDVVANLQAEELELAKEAEKQKRTAALISDQMYSDSQELLRLFGIPFVVSPMEAEAQCAVLDKLELVHGTITEDSDIWLFGGRKVYKNFFNQKKQVECFQHSDIKHYFGLDQPKLISLAMLTGSDYTDGIEGIGCVSAMEILSEFPGGGIESLCAFKKWWEDVQKQVKVPQETKVKAKLRNVALHPGFPNEAVFNAYLTPTVDESREPFSWSLPDLDLLRDFAESNFGWGRAKVDGILLPLVKRLTATESQTRLDKFIVTLDKTSPRLPSKRLCQAIAKVSSAGSAAADDGKQKAKEALKRKPTKRNVRDCASNKGKRKPISNRKGDPQAAKKRTMPVAGPCLSEDSSASD